MFICVCENIKLDYIQIKAEINTYIYIFIYLQIINILYTYIHKAGIKQEGVKHV
jgi:hypothetical protein